MEQDEDEEFRDRGPTTNTSTGEHNDGKP